MIIIKRLFDLFISAITLLLLSPILLVLLILVRVDSPGPAIFCQRRIGQDDKEFVMYKFRTMIVGTPEVATDKLSHSSAYITKTGYYLRKYSLDELPQLINILLGQMSFVGPRPALFNQYDLRQLRNDLGISLVKPGLTGWAQINGRDDISMENKVAFDQYYLVNQSFLLDMQILFRTFHSVYAGTGERKATSGQIRSDKIKHM